MKKKLEIGVDDLLRSPVWRGTAKGLLEGRRDFDKVFEDQEYYLRPKKVNQPNLPPWNLYLRKSELAYHQGCGIIAQRYSVKHGESGRPFCTKCGHTLGRGARDLLLGWDGTVFPVRREGLQAFFLTPPLPKLEELAPPPLDFGQPIPAARPFVRLDHPRNCGCPDCTWEPRPFAGRNLEHDPEDDFCPCEGCRGPRRYPEPFSTSSGATRFLGFPHLHLKLGFPREIFSERDFSHIRAAVTLRNEDNVEAIDTLCRREAQQMGRDAESIFRAKESTGQV